MEQEEAVKDEEGSGTTDVGKEVNLVVKDSTDKKDVKGNEEERENVGSGDDGVGKEDIKEVMEVGENAVGAGGGVSSGEIDSKELMQEGDSGDSSVTTLAVKDGTGNKAEKGKGVRGENLGSGDDGVTTEDNKDVMEEVAAEKTDDNRSVGVSKADNTKVIGKGKKLKHKSDTRKGKGMMREGGMVKEGAKSATTPNTNGVMEEKELGKVSKKEEGVGKNKMKKEGNVQKFRTLKFWTLILRRKIQYDISKLAYSTKTSKFVKNTFI